MAAICSGLNVMKKLFIFWFKYHWSLYPMVQWVKSSLVQVITWRRTGDNGWWPWWRSSYLSLSLSLSLSLLHSSKIKWWNHLSTPKFNGYTVQLWEWTSNFIPHLIGHVLTYTCWNQSSLQWRHNGRHGVSNHQPHDSLLNRLFRLRSKKTSKLCVTGLCAGNSPVTGEFPAQMASNAENVYIWWRHHVNPVSRRGPWCPLLGCTCTSIQR